jgi:predicted  nucleic acid-binding Zn-ribbon protein
MIRSRAAEGIFGALPLDFGVAFSFLRASWICFTLGILLYAHIIMEAKLQADIDHLHDVIKEKYDVLVNEKERIDNLVDDIQKDINQGRSKTPRTELMKQQDELKRQMNTLKKEFIGDRDSLMAKIERLEDIKRKREEEVRLGMESVEYNIENIQKYIDGGNTNDVFHAIKSIKNALVIINNKLGE